MRVEVCQKFMRESAAVVQEVLLVRDLVRRVVNRERSDPVCRWIGKVLAEIVSPLYRTFNRSELPVSGPHSTTGTPGDCPLEKLYQFDPIPAQEL